MTAPKVSSSSNTPTQQRQLSGGQTNTSEISGLTRADLHQFKHNLKQQLHQKIQTLSSLRTDIEIFLKGVQKEIGTVSEKLQTYQGRPGQLPLSLKYELNMRSQAVQIIDIEISETLKEVKELQENIKGCHWKCKIWSEVTRNWLLCCH